MLTARGKQIRKDAYLLSKKIGGYHYGGTFSSIEILYTLYDKVLTKDDKFILSKGHSCWGLYVLLKERGLNPPTDCHPYRDPANGIDWTTGSEGHGLPAGLGIAFAKFKLGKPGKVFVMLGDGECQEGTTWESLLLGGKHNLNNVVAIVDNNKIQGSGFVDDILPVGDKMSVVASACGWKTKTIDGHNEDEIYSALTEKSTAPLFIIANTVKGKGVSYMENKPEWHSKWPNVAEESKLLEELS
jgi:transketolase